MLTCLFLVSFGDFLISFKFIFASRLRTCLFDIKSFMLFAWSKIFPHINLNFSIWDAATTIILILGYALSEVMLFFSPLWRLMCWLTFFFFKTSTVKIHWFSYGILFQLNVKINNLWPYLGVGETLAEFTIKCGYKSWKAPKETGCFPLSFT